jgi:hypothetical protein
MKRKYWWIFGAIQLLGLLSAIEGLLLLEDPVMFGLSLLLLLPGTLVSFPLSTLGHVGTHWPIWTVYPIAVIANVLLFAVASSLVARVRKSK